jgi:hypothetical protein
MIGRRHPSLTSAVTAGACMLLIAVALGVAGCGESQEDRVAAAMERYARESPVAVARAKPFGPLERVSCEPLGEGRRYRGENVFLCDVIYSKGATMSRCAALVSAKLYTSDQDPNLPCLPRIGQPMD